jgi:hypothetical protein
LKSNLQIYLQNFTHRDLHLENTKFKFAARKRQI